jgi:ferredoxin
MTPLTFVVLLAIMMDAAFQFNHLPWTRQKRIFTNAFVVVSTKKNDVRPNRGSAALLATSSESSSTERMQQQQQPKFLAVTLEKPLGMILEEVEEGGAKGVYVKELAEGGSAAASEWGDELVGLPVFTVMGRNVMAMDFDSVMEELISAPSPVELQFVMEENAIPSDGSINGGRGEVEFDVGTIVTLKVLEDNGKKETLIEARVGDNLRQTLLDSKVEVYRGLKAKLGNCNGGGQCTFCRADFVETEGWAPRSDYEERKLKNAPDARLTCQNNIQGPATIRM